MKPSPDSSPPPAPSPAPPRCPMAKSDMTPCAMKDGKDAIADDGVCVGCGCELVAEVRHEGTRAFFDGRFKPVPPPQSTSNPVTELMGHLRAMHATDPALYDRLTKEPGLAEPFSAVVALAATAPAPSWRPQIISDPSVPRDEVHMRDSVTGKLLGKIVNVDLAASPAQEATPPREQEQDQGWTKKDQRPEQAARDALVCDALRYLGAAFHPPQCRANRYVVSGGLTDGSMCDCGLTAARTLIGGGLYGCV